MESLDQRPTISISHRLEIRTVPIKSNDPVETSVSQNRQFSDTSQPIAGLKARKHLVPDEP